MVLVIVIITICIFYYLSKIKYQPSPTKKIIRKLLDENKNGASLAIRKQNDRSIVAVGEKFDVILTADSLKSLVYGLDAVVSFDPDVISYDGVKGVDPNFELVGTEKDGSLIITGILGNNVDPVELKQTPLAIVTFTAKKQGDAGIKLVLDEKSNTSDSNIFTKESVDIIKKVDDMSVLVGETVSMVNSDVHTIDKAQLELLSVELPEAGCLDCISKATIRVIDGVSSGKLELTTGGVAGNIHQSQELFGVLYELDSISQEKVVLYYAPINL